MRIRAKLSCFTLAALCATPSFYAVAADAPAPPLTSGLQLDTIDRSVRPQDDLYDYANGLWMKSTKIPDDRSSYGAAEIMAERALEQQRTLMEAAATATDPEARKVGELYASFMDEERVESLGLAPLEGELAQIAATDTPAKLAALHAHMDRIGVLSPFQSSAQQDQRNSSQYADDLWQSGIGMPDRDYFLKANPQFKAARKAYRAHIEAMLHLAGDTDAKAEAAAIYQLELQLAKIHWTQVALRDPIKTYNKRTLAELRQMLPGFDWTTYLDKRGLSGKVTSVIVGQPTYLRALQNIYQTTPLSTWRAYYRFHLLAAFAPDLPARSPMKNFHFPTTCSPALRVKSHAGNGRWRWSTARSAKRPASFTSRLISRQTPKRACS